MREQNLAFKQKLRESKIRTTRRHNFQMLACALTAISATLAIAALQFVR